MSADDLAGRRILVVEDEAMIAMLLEDILDELGCAVVGPVARADQALTAIEAESLDGAVLDVNLNGEPSYEVADALAARGVPFMFITGYGEAGLKDGYRHHPVMQKPFTRDDLDRALRGLVVS